MVQELHEGLLSRSRSSYNLELTMLGLRVLRQELLARPGQAPAILARFWRLKRRSKIYLDSLKPIKLAGGRTKMGLYVPGLYSDALLGRMQRSLRSDLLAHEQVTISVTDECPCLCAHCFNARSPKTPMPMERLLKFVRQIQEIGGSFINIGGGEPGMAFDRTLALVEGIDSRSECWLNTTGLGLDRQLLGRLKTAGLFGVRVSIHYSQPSLHDEFVGYKGAFDRAMKTLFEAGSCGLFPVLTCAMTLDRIQPRQIEAMMELGKQLGAGIVEVLPIRPAGRAIMACSHGDLTAQVRQVVDRACYKYNRNKEYIGYPALNTPAYFETPDRFGCVAGSERLFVSTAGDVQPCPLVNLSMGNLMSDGLEAIEARLKERLALPRRHLLCMQLEDILKKHLSDHGSDLDLPLPPNRSQELLRMLPDGGRPGAYI